MTYRAKERKRAKLTAVAVHCSVCDTTFTTDNFDFDRDYSDCWYESDVPSTVLECDCAHCGAKLEADTW